MERDIAFIRENLSKMAELLTLLQDDIDDDFRAYEDSEDATPSMLVTFATDERLTTWTYQTGDTQFMGACYHYPIWASVVLERDSDCKELAKDAIETLINGGI